MKILDRYVLKSFVFNYMLSLITLISLYVVLDLFVNFDEFTEGQRPVVSVVGSIADYYFYNLPLYFHQLSGVISAFAACATLARLHRLNEVTSILASGTSMYRLSAPIILAGMATNALVILDQEIVLPSVAAKLARNRDDVEGARAYGIWCVRDGENRLLSARQFSPKQGRIRGLIVMELAAEPEFEGRMGDVILADKAEWTRREGRQGWRLERGIRISVRDAWTGDLRRDNVLDRTPIDFYEAELPPEELMFRQTAQWVRFLSLRQLQDLQRRQDVDTVQVAQIKHGRLTLPINNMIMLLMGLVFFMHRLPGAVLTQGAKALGMCAASFLVVFIGQQVVGAATPQLVGLPAWLPIFLFGPVVAVLLSGVRT